MRQYQLRKWKSSPDLTGLLFFSQVVEEALFDYSIDNFKLPALNSYRLTQELIQTLDLVKMGTINPGAISPIQQEIEHSYKNDPVVQKILGQGVSVIAKEIRKADLVEDDALLRYLFSELGAQYFDVCKSQIFDLVKTGKEKEAIIRITRSFLIELIYNGYSHDHIYYRNRNYFYEGAEPQEIISSEQIKGFVELFDFKTKEWDVVFSVSHNANLIAELSIIKKVKNLTISTKDEILSKFSKGKLLIRDAGLPEMYFLVINVSAKDPFAARKEARDILEGFNQLISLYAHKQKINYLAENIVMEKGSGLEFFCKAPVSPVLKRPDVGKTKLSEHLNRGVQRALSGAQNRKIFSAIQSHSLALTSQSQGQQLVAFWGAVELLFSRPTKSGNKIDVLMNRMIPFLLKEHISFVLAHLWLAVSRDNAYLNIINRNPRGATPKEKFVSLLVLPELKTLLDDLCQECATKSPLLGNRIGWMNGRFSSPKKLLDFLDAYEERVRWQVQRIYRARNQFVHSGEEAFSIKTLIENVHFYVDQIFYVLNKESESRDFEEIVEKIGLDWKIKKEALVRLGSSEFTYDGYLQFYR